MHANSVMKVSRFFLPEIRFFVFVFLIEGSPISAFQASSGTGLAGGFQVFFLGEPFSSLHIAHVKSIGAAICLVTIQTVFTVCLFIN